MAKDAREVFAINLTRLLAKKNKTQADLVHDLSLSQSTVSDWVNAKKYPRVDKMELLADYFGVLKFNLTEETASYPNMVVTNPQTGEINENITEEEMQQILKDITSFSPSAKNDIELFLEFLQYKYKK